VIISARSLEELNRPGAKGLGLRLASRLGIDIPPTWGVDAEHFDSLLAELGRLNADSAAHPEAASTLLDEHPVRVMDQPCVEGPVIMRASSEEPLDRAAGLSGCLLSTVVSSAEVAPGIEAVWLSALAPEVQRQMRVTGSPLGGVAVLIQPWLSPRISGVAHTDGGAISLAITAGHLDPLVGGETNGGTVRVRLAGPHSGLVEGPPDTVQLLRQSTSGTRLSTLVEACITLREHFDGEIEIEWLIDDRSFRLLQVQPLPMASSGAPG